MSPDQTSSRPSSSASSEVRELLSLDQLTDEEKRKQVEAFFTDEKDKIREVASGQRDKFKDLMKEMNRTKAGADRIIEAILAKMFEGNLERSVRSRYGDVFADAVLAETIDFEGDDDTKEELNSNPAYQKARGRILATIRAGVLKFQQSKKKYMKPQYIDQYAKAVCEKYVKNMDEDIWFRVTEENVEKDLKPMTIDEWLNAHPELTPDELFYDFDVKEAKRFIGDVAGVKRELAKIDPSAKGLNAKLSHFFATEVSKIEAEVMGRPDNPQQVVEAAKALSTAFASALVLSKYQASIHERLNEIASLKDKIPDLDPSFEAGYKKINGEIEHAITTYLQKKDAEALKLEATAMRDLDAKLEAAKNKASETAKKEEEAAAEDEAAAAAKEEEPPDLLEDPKGFIAHMLKGHPIMAAVFGIFGFDKMIDKMMNKEGGIFERLSFSKHLVNARTLLEEIYKFEEEEVNALHAAKVGELLKRHSPPEGVDAKRFKTLQEDLRLNGGDENTKENFVHFLKKVKVDNWKQASEEEKNAPKPAPEKDADSAQPPAEKKDEKKEESPTEKKPEDKKDTPVAQKPSEDKPKAA